MALARVPLLAVGLASLVLGVLSGLARMGIELLPAHAAHLGVHGALMLGGFFGTVISLERAVALGRRWSWIAPISAAIGALGLWAGFAVAVSATVFTLASTVLVSASLALHRRQPTLHSTVLIVGATCWLAGNLVWLASGRLEAAIGLWIDFLVLTIAGERLELSRFLPPAPLAKRMFVAIATACLIGAVAWVVAPRAAAAILAVGYGALAVWLLRQDVARRTAREAALTGFIGRCLLSGYIWLAIGGVLLVGFALAPSALLWDAALHAVLLGFVLSMVFGHAPIIFPAVVRVCMPYHWTFYVPLTALHASLAVRIAGDVLAEGAWRAAGGLGNAAAIALFVASTIGAVVRGSLSPRSAPLAGSGSR
jgi:hypothetical protein